MAPRSQLKKLQNKIRREEKSPQHRTSFRRLDTLQLEDRVVPAAQMGFFPASFFHYETDPAAYSTEPTGMAANNAVQSYLQQNSHRFNLDAADYANLLTTSQYTDDLSGVERIYLRQRVHGLEVAHANLTFAVSPAGRVTSIAGGLVNGLSSQLTSESVTPTRTPAQAVQMAIQALAAAGDPIPKDSHIIQTPMASNDLERTALVVSNISLEPIAARLHFVPTADGSAVLAWQLNIQTRDTLHWYDLSIADGTGELVALHDWVDSDSYNALPPPNESVQDGGFSVVTNPANATASPFGWHDTNGVAGAEFTDTRGNNVDAHLDRNADNAPDASPVRPDGGATLNFSGFTFDPASDPLTLQNQNVSQVNLFYMNNVLHDLHYQYGFTAAAGNFQENLYGAPTGKGGDPVQADSQDGSGTNNANFATPADGTDPRMQMYIFTAATPDRDSSLDNGIVTHEYGHGVSNRLVGGPNDSSSLSAVQSGGMGEGWSDFYAMMFQYRAADLPTDAHGMGTYALNQPDATGPGIRRFRYSFDTPNKAGTHDPLTWGAYGSGTTSYGLTRSTQVHNTGEIWCSTLLDMNWLLIAKYGFDANLYTGWSPNPGPANAGNKLTLRLVMDGMKLMAANPSFTQARDAILAADTALTGGSNHLEIWTAFARRGLGANAAVQVSTSTATIVDDFTIPNLGLSVISTVPAKNAVIPTPVTSFTVNTTDPMTPASVQASDLKVNGIAATGVSYTAGTSTITFTYGASPIAAQGVQTIAIAAGAFTRASDSDASDAYSSTFRYDAVLMAVTSTSPAVGSTVTLPFTQLDLNLNEAVLLASVATTDFTVSQGSVSGFSLINGNQTIRLTLAGLTTEGSLNVDVASNAITDSFGNANVAFTGTYQLDYGTRVFPVLTAVAPLGGRTYQGMVTGLINTGTDSDDITVSLDPNQVLSLVLTPAAGLRPRLQVTGPGVALDVSAAADGDVIVIPATAISGGLYTLRVLSVAGTSGTFSLQASLNAARELESLPGGADNNSTATAESLAAATLTTATGPSTSTRAAVVGLTDSSSGYVATTPAYAFEDIAPTGTKVLSNSDDGTAGIAFPAGFTFDFYGTTYSNAFVSVNGMITFGSSNGAYDNSFWPGTPGQAAIAAYWDDLHTGAVGAGSVLWQVLGSGADERLVVQWNDLRYYDGGTNTLDLQAILYEATGKIRFNYANLSNGQIGHDEGVDATVGIKNATDTVFTLAHLDGPNDFVGSGKSTLLSPQSQGADYYAFSAVGGQAVSLAVNALGAGAVNVDLYDTDGTTLLASGVGGPTNFTSGILSFTLPGAGAATYYAAVSGGSLVPYGLTVTSNSAFDAEDNDSAATAQDLGDSRAIAGHIAAANEDWFAVTMPAGHTSLALESSTPGDGAGEFVNALNPLLRVYDASGVTLLGTGVAMPDGRNETLTINSLTPGTSYRIRVVGTAGSSGEYVVGARTSNGVAPVVSGITVNSGDAQRSRVRTITVNFASPVNAGQFQAAGAVTLTRLATSGAGTPLGFIVDALNGLIVSPGSGSTSSITLTFANTVNGGVENTSLADGRWQLAIPVAGYASNDTIVAQRIRRLFGDSNGDGTVDGTDFSQFGSVFGNSSVAFDYDNNGTIDGTDFGELGGRFGRTI